MFILLVSLGLDWLILFTRYLDLTKEFCWVPFWIPSKGGGILEGWAINQLVPPVEKQAVIIIV